MIGNKFVLHDWLSHTHAQGLKASLYSFFNTQKPLGSTLPPGYQLIYCNTQAHEETLLKDGYDSHQAPDDSCFKRRMWIGGNMNFLRPLHFGQQATCVETVQRFRKIRDNYYVDIHREVIQNEQPCFEELRQLIYTSHPYVEPAPKHVEHRPQFTHELTPTDTLLFRYSALTFNSHKIHIDKQYAQSEGYPTILVQGPLTVTLLLEWVDTLYDNLPIRSFKYKNSSPIFSNEPMKLCLRETSDGMDLWIEGHGRKLLMDAHLTVEGSMHDMTICNN
jgi:hydroxyacyl-ACP dehydratase HTD2-like protein with hotdog domain